MTFDTRARQAAQGIYGAVEVMELSSTKTPQRVTRFDQYRERKSRNQRIRAGVLAIVLVLVGVIVLARAVGRAVPAEPSPSPTPTSVSGSSDLFEAPFTYTVTQDWTLSGEGPRYFSLDATDGSAHLIVLSNVWASASELCSDRPKEGVGTNAITSWLSTRPALDATTPRPVRLGAATGSYVDIQLAARGIRKNCPNGLGLVTGKPEPPQGWGILAGQRERVYVLDLYAGGTVTILITAYQASDFRNVIDQATPVVQSFDFHR
jgi:hypothetical protein